MLIFVNDLKKRVEDMRICIFSTAYLPFVGGAEVALDEIIKRFPPDWEFDVFTARLDGRLPRVEQMGRVRVIRIGQGGRFDKYLLALRGAAHAARKHAQHPYDLVWSMMASYGGFAALTFKKKIGVPFLLTLQEGDSPEHIMKRVGIFKERFKQIFKKADGLQAISTYLLEWGKHMGFDSLKPHKMIPNGFDANRFKPVVLQGIPNNFREEFGIHHTGTLIVTVSRLVRKNGVDILLRALAELPQEYHLAVAGEGEEEPTLKSLAENLGVNNRVYFLGTILHDRLPDLYKSATVFCRPSRSEGLGIVFLEAMASKLPVVATHVGGISDIVRHEETGLLCASEDYHDCAQKIRRLVDDEALRKHCVENAFEFVRRDFQWDVIAQRMRELMEGLV